MITIYQALFGQKRKADWNDLYRLGLKTLTQTLANEDVNSPEQAFVFDANDQLSHINPYQNKKHTRYMKSTTHRNCQ